MITASLIKVWAKKPENKEKAKQLGLRLVANQGSPEKLKELPSLGDFEDKVQDWAIKHPIKAKLLLIELATSGKWIVTGKQV